MKILLLFYFLSINTLFNLFKTNSIGVEGQFTTYIVDLKYQELKLFWKNDKGQIFGSISKLKNYVESKNKSLIFAMNGGMFNSNLKPLGLFIEDGRIQKKINTSQLTGNLKLIPNGIFYISDDNIPFISSSFSFEKDVKVKYATQSGPMLLLDGNINPIFKFDSKSNVIRNGVGILPDNKILFVISKKKINFYRFAKFFQSMGCLNALYLDGCISRIYLPEKRCNQIDGKFAVIIGVTENKKE